MGSPCQDSHTLKIIGLLLIMILMLGCHRQDEVQAIRTLITNSVRDAEAHRISALLAVTTADFESMPGRYNRGTTGGILFRAFTYYGRFKIHYPRPLIEIGNSADEGSATIFFLLVREEIDLPHLGGLTDNPQQWLQQAQEKADLYQLRLNLVKIDRKWAVRQAHLQGFKGTGF